MNRCVCIHGHFYQPPRQNPWLEDIEMDDSAYPYHDWNEKITEECYRPNADSRILGPDKKIIDIVNNYSKISFNFGPTLLSWLQRHAPDVYQSIIEADKKSRELFSGHGAAIAQAYNHMIMPLANSRDKRTQVIWAISDFEYRFGRKPEGMWLPETAVDLETLDILAEHDIKFTILAPQQARRVRRIGTGQWQDVDRNSLDTTQPYLCRLASDRTISLFFHNGAVSGDVAEGVILQNGEVFAQRLTDVFTETAGRKAQLANIATDGETYGHHHRYTDMALAYCLHYIETNHLARITIYGEYLEQFPAAYEVEIKENTSWSCEHGIERWRSNCGCAYGRYPAGSQQWRGPLREAMDWLRDQLVPVYEDRMAEYVPDPWELRNKYICVVNDRSGENTESFISNSAGTEPAYEQKVTFLKLLEMQRNAMLMYTSCGWFFDDICGIEAVQIMLYAARAIQMAKEITGRDFEPGFRNILKKAPTNVKEFATGRQAYRVLVKPGNIDLNRVGAHFAVSSIFERYPRKTDIYCYTANTELYDRLEAGTKVLVTGKATVQSNIILERHSFDFAVLHFGDHNLICGVNARMSDDRFFTIQQNLKSAFTKGDTPEVMHIMNRYFPADHYSLWHLFKDDQRRILNKMLEETQQETEASFRHLYEHNYTIMQVMRGMNIPLPKALSAPADFILNQDLGRVLEDDQAEPAQLRALVDEATKLSLHLDQAILRFKANHKINRLMNKLADCPGDVNLLETINATVGILLTVISELDLHTAQNVFFAISTDNYANMRKEADAGNETARKWIEHFKNMAHYLDVRLE